MYLYVYNVPQMPLNYSQSVIKFSSVQFLVAYKERKGNVLFNDTLNTFYLRIYGVRLMVKDHLDSERGNPLPPHGLLFD